MVLLFDKYKKNMGRGERGVADFRRWGGCAFGTWFPQISQITQLGGVVW